MTHRLLPVVLIIAAFLIIGAGNLCASDYWQQEVNYVMEVTLDKDLRTIEGFIEIEYINNSPDTLYELFLKAFPNAIRRGSYADLKGRQENDYSFANLTPEEEGSLILTDRSGVVHHYISFARDNTIVRVELSRPLLPSDTVDLSFDFKVILPRPASMRMGYHRGTVKAAYWFPQVCVYDRRLGWVNSQYLGWGECYGDFGRFDVTIIAPEDQIVAATGELVNRSEALPDDLRDKLDIKNYLKPESEWPDLSLDPSRVKKWRYVAENVNDFVWTSSNQFCIDSGSVNGVKVVSYPLRHKAAEWTEAVRFGKEAVETFSELYYPYQWPVVRICDAYSGMEYPMLTNCSGGGTSSRFAFLLYHEIGHFWFQGQVGSNQVDRPFLDEGFTTHMEHNIVEKYFGEEDNFSNYSNWYQKRYAPPIKDRNARGFRPLLQLMRQGLDKPMIYTSYDHGEEYWPYRVSAYYKSAAMHYSLRSILGDSLYYQAMHHYCDKWFFKHPYEDDFIEAMEEATNLELDQYLEQWYYSLHRLDYAYGGRKSKKDDKGINHTITIKRVGEFVAPIDVAIIWEQGDTTFYTIAPEGMAYAKPGHILLPTWNQFRRYEPEYKFIIRAARDIDKVVIDPDNLLMDIDRMNNQSGCLPPIEARWDNLFFDRVPVNEYALRYRPDVWYNEPDGVQLGFHSHGAYHDVQDKFSVDFRLGTESGKPTVDLTLADEFPMLGYNSHWWTRDLYTGERSFYSVGIAKRFRRFSRARDGEWLKVEMTRSLIRSEDEEYSRRSPMPEEVLEYLPDQAWTKTETWQGKFTLGGLKSFRYGKYSAQFEIGMGAYRDLNSYPSFITHRFSGQIDITLSRNNKIRARGTALATQGKPPAQYLDHISRGLSIDRYTDSKLFREPGTMPTAWESDVYLANGFVRGYQDRAMYVTEYAGLAVDWWPQCWLPLHLFKRIPYVGNWLSGARRSLWVDMAATAFDAQPTAYRGSVAANEIEEYDGDPTFVMSAGVSFWMPSVWNGQSIRLDFPLYLNKPIPGDNEFDFRFSVAWLLPADF